MAEREDVEVHLATCAQCAGELARYREVLTAVASVREVVEEPPEGFRDRLLLQVTDPARRWRSELRRIVHDRRTHVAAASLGGAVVGAGAIALLWWRVARRAVVGDHRVPV